jgi:hypothetical protein
MKLTVGDLGYFDYPVIQGLVGSGANSAHQNHDGVVVVAADRGGKKEEDYEDGGLVSPEAMRASLHRAMSTAAAAESVGGGCCCALDLNLNMFKWGIRWFVVWLNVVGLDFLAVEFKLKVVGVSRN